MPSTSKLNTPTTQAWLRLRRLWQVLRADALPYFLRIALGTWLCAGLSAQAALPEAVQRVKPSVVVVGTYQRTRSPAFQFMGTGFVVGDGRLIATNAHVKLKQALNTEQLEILVVAVPSAGGTSAMREVLRVAEDAQHDLALLQLKSGDAMPALGLSDSEVREGQAIAFMGFPIGSVLGFYPATHAGVIAAIAPVSMPKANANRLDGMSIRQLGGQSFAIYQLDAIAYPGSSGSPLFDPETAQVVGVVNSGRIRNLREAGLSDPTGITYAIPVEHLKRLLAEPRGDVK